MTRIPGWIKTVSLVAGLAITSTASATLGYFGLGYGAKAMGVAGAVVANPQDSATIAVNPAGITAVGERVDIGARMFSPQRKAELETSAIGANFDVKDDSRRNLFLIPNLGFNIQLGENLWFGFNNYANGGMNSTYDRNLYDEASAVVGAFGQGFAAALAAGATPEQAQAAGEAAAGMVPKGTTTSDVLLDPVTGKPLIKDVGTLGVDLAQGILAPTLAMKFRN
ncbi:MAG: outer membrane protein transport protein, partial [Pseudomonadota bacterium]|nr:outer membrane protein transport protein [Pseudomonadota bacterium]